MQASQRLLGLDLPAAPEVVDLGGGEGLDLHVGVGRVDGADDALVVLEGPVGMVAADDVHLAAVRLHHGHHVLDGVLVGAGLALLAREVAEATGEDAEVGRGDVAVDDEVDALALPPRLHRVGHPAHAQQVGGLEQERAVLAAEALRPLRTLSHTDLQTRSAKCTRASSFGSRDAGPVTPRPTSRSDSSQRLPERCQDRSRSGAVDWTRRPSSAAPQRAEASRSGERRSAVVSYAGMTADSRRFFDEIEIGEEYESPGRTVTETDIVIFAGLSGDYNVLHTDAEFMKGSIFGERIAHGLLGLAIQAGLFSRATPPYATTAFTGLRWKFKGPIKIGDTIRVRAKVVAKRDDRQARPRPDHPRAEGPEPARRGGPGGRDGPPGGAPGVTAAVARHATYFEDVVVGERDETPAMTVTEAHVALYRGLTGDDGRAPPAWCPTCCRCACPPGWAGAWPGPRSPCSPS